MYPNLLDGALNFIDRSCTCSVRMKQKLPRQFDDTPLSLVYASLFFPFLPFSDVPTPKS